MASRPSNSRSTASMTHEELLRSMRFPGSKERRPTLRGSSAEQTKKEKQKQGKNFDKKLGVQRNQVFGTGGTDIFEEKDPKKSSYVDQSRALDSHLVDVKKAMRKVKKSQNMSKEQRRQNRERRFIDTAEFESCGGITGCITAAKNLMATKKKFSEALEYLDAAIAHGAREAAIFGFESGEMLTSRNLRARCYLNLSRLREAQAEAEQVLKFNSSDGTAVLIMAEALYLQCRFERSLVLYHRGFRLRVELYGDAFKEGIEKTTSSIICGLANLNAENIRLYRQHPNFKDMAFKHDSSNVFELAHSSEDNNKKSALEENPLDLAINDSKDDVVGDFLSFIREGEKNSRKTTGSKEEPSQLDRELAEAAKTKVAAGAQDKVFHDIANSLNPRKKIMFGKKRMVALKSIVGRNPMSWVQKHHGLMEDASSAAQTSAGKISQQHGISSAMSEDEVFIRSLLRALTQSNKSGANEVENKGLFMDHSVEAGGGGKPVSSVSVKSPQQQSQPKDAPIVTMSKEILEFIESRKEFWELQEQSVNQQQGGGKAKPSHHGKRAFQQC